VPELSDAKRRILDRLKRVETATVPELAIAFGLTDTAIRQHLEALEVAGMAERAPSTPAGRGRPPVAWRLSAEANDLFPDRHADLTVELLSSIRDALGDDGLDKVIAARAVGQRSGYRKVLPDPASATVAERVATLAQLRSAEGYLAEMMDGEDGTLLLVEHHCPIADAARTCSGFCSSELELFRAVLGDDVAVERTQHLLAGDQRCAYRIRATGPSTPAAAAPPTEG
jgi:predicted ArsR family transcriptional regulator